MQAGLRARLRFGVSVLIAAAVLGTWPVWAAAPESGSDAPVEAPERSTEDTPFPADGPMSRVVGVEPDRLTCFAGGAALDQMVTAEDLSERMRDGEAYELFDLSGRRGDAVSIGAPIHEGGDGECVDLWRQELSIDPRQTGDLMVALGRSGMDKNPLPGSLEVLDAPLPGHVALLKRFLSNRQVADPQPRFEQVIKVDLEGDGRDEYILNVVRTGAESARAGDHSILLVVRGETATSRTFIIQDEYDLEDSDFSSTLWRNTVVAVIDVDGDGVAEIVTTGSYVYGGGWEVIRFDGSGFEHVLFCGCDG